MRLRTIKKNVTQNCFMFPMEMYTSLPGSIIVTSYILNEKKPDLLDIKKKWKYYTRHGFDFDFTDKDYIKKVCDKFGVEMFPLEYAAFVMSEHNALITPYLEIDGVKDILPLREDGYFSRTLRVGKVYPLTDKEKIEVVANG